MSTRAFAAAVTGLFCVLALAGCGGEGSEAAPPVTLVRVEAAGGDAPPGTLLNVLFSGPIRPDAATVPGLMVLDMRGATVAGAWSTAPDRLRLHFAPSAPIVYRSRYSVRIPAAILAGGAQTSGVVVGDPPDADLAPVLKNLAVRFEPFDPTTRRMGDVTLTDPTRKPFLEFGAVVKDPQGRDKVLPDFAFLQVVPGTTLVSPIDGVVVAIEQQREGDVELRLRPSATSDWMVYLDHVDGVMVKVGDRVVAGQPLCRTAGAFELNVMYSRQGAEKVVAPFTHFDPASSQRYQDLIWDLMAKAEELSGHPEWYDEAAMRPIYAGCRVREMAPY